jgi:hypothetical protein
LPSNILTWPWRFDADWGVVAFTGMWNSHSTPEGNGHVLAFWVSDDRYMVAPPSKVAGAKLVERLGQSPEPNSCRNGCPFAELQHVTSRAGSSATPEGSVKAGMNR